MIVEVWGTPEVFEIVTDPVPHALEALPLLASPVYVALHCHVPGAAEANPCKVE